MLKHQTRWDAQMLPDGTVRWTSPTGRVHHDAVAEPVDTTADDLLLHGMPPDMAPPDAAPPDYPGPPPF